MLAGDSPGLKVAAEGAQLVSHIPPGPTFVLPKELWNVAAGLCVLAGGAWGELHSPLATCTPLVQCNGNSHTTWARPRLHDAPSPGPKGSTGWPLGQRRGPTRRGIAQLSVLGVFAAEGARESPGRGARGATGVWVGQVPRLGLRSILDVGKLVRFGDSFGEPLFLGGDRRGWSPTSSPLPPVSLPL